MAEKVRLSRRGFLALAGGAVGATALTCCGLSALGSRQPAVEFAEASCGEGNNVDKRILVAYGSRCGSTGGIAEIIGEVLCVGGATVDVRLVKDVGDLAPYQAVVVGSAIRQGRLLPEIVEFVKTHRGVLNQVPAAYFVACLTMTKDSAESRGTASAYLDPLREMVQPVSEGLFAGALDYAKISLPEQLILRMMGSTEGDFRDWGMIRGWAGGLQSLLLSD